MNVVFIGGGNMADALIGGMLKSGFATSQLRAVEVDGAARRRLFEKYRVECIAESRGNVRAGEVVVFAVKPQQMQEAARFSGLKPNANLVVSIAAGITLASLAGWLGGPNVTHTKLVRAMPNTPALIGAGIAGLYALSGVDGDGRTHAASVLEAVGGTLWCEREDELDAVTAVSGSGPAYVFYFIEALESAARELGFEPLAARRLALATFSGAARLAEQSDSEPALLRAQVTSKGGTTERAISVLDEAAVMGAIIAAVKAAAERAHELGDRFGNEP